MENDFVKNGLSTILGYNPDNDMIYATAVGVMSTVTKEKADGTGQPIGHVAMLDIENSRLDVVKDYAQRHLDAYFIFSSSQGNFHVIDVVIRSLAEINDLMARIPLQDGKHRIIGLDQEGLTLRISEKGYKSRPVLQYSHSKLLGAKDGNRVLSEPHLQFIAQHYGDELAKALTAHPRAVGDGLRNVVYQTIHKNGER